MRVLFLFPIVGNEGNIKPILQEFERLSPKLYSLGGAGTNLECKFPGMDYVYLSVGEKVTGQPKGRGITDAIKNVSETPDYIIVCDGSGKIPCAHILDVFRELISDSSTHCVMAERIGKNKAISTIRHLIERWEVFALIHLFNSKTDILDGQCGLWGYYAKKIEQNGETCEIKLTASSYDVELDLLSEILSKKLNLRFIGITLPAVTNITSSFTYVDNILKIRFLINKYPAFKDYLPRYLEEFQKINATEIGALSLEDKNTWKNYVTDMLKP